ncbi:hypothetical protein ES703_100935 [subsurface metagenome]
MGHCNVDDVKAVVSTDMEVHNIQDLIDEVDVLMALEITVSGVDSKVLRAISRTWTAYRVMLKDPASESLDGHSENRSDNLARYEAMYKEMLDNASTSGGIVFKMTSSPIG